MNRNELIEKYKAFIAEAGILPEHALVGAGGAMLLMGLREETRDIDLEVPLDIFEAYAARYEEVEYEVHEVTGIRKARVVPDVMGCIDLHVMYFDRRYKITDGVAHYTASEVLQQKQRMNRSKDQEDIKKLLQCSEGTIDYLSVANFLVE